MNGLWSQIFVLLLVRVLSLVFFREITRFNLFFFMFVVRWMLIQNKKYVLVISGGGSK